jgi:hypothetical protein
VASRKEGGVQDRKPENNQQRIAMQNFGWEKDLDRIINESTCPSFQAKEAKGDTKYQVKL